MTVLRRAEVLVVGGGLAGAAIAIRLARLGRDVVVLEQSPRPRWMACGVFTAAPSSAWTALGLAPDAVDRLTRSIPLFQLVAPGGTQVPLAYGAAAAPGDGLPAATGLDRPRIDAELLHQARRVGARIERGQRVVDVEAEGGHRPATVAVTSRKGRTTIDADVVVGADGLRSRIAARLGVARPSGIPRRIALTYHLRDRRTPTGTDRDGWMFVIRGGYVGIAPVPGERVNIGIVLDVAKWGSRLRSEGAQATALRIVRSLPLSAELRSALADDRPLDSVAGVAPVAHAVHQLAGDGWLLAGDAAGFLDPFTGEGIGRALVTAELAADAVDAWLRGDRLALARYAHDVRARYRARDRLTGLVQLFLGHPGLFDYAARRLASRARERSTLGLVLAERLPASVALDPRFLGAVLRP